MCRRADNTTRLLGKPPDDGRLGGLVAFVVPTEQPSEDGARRSFSQRLSYLFGVSRAWAGPSRLCWRHRSVATLKA
jgi:hypothetical protein